MNAVNGFRSVPVRITRHHHSDDVPASNHAPPPQREMIVTVAPPRRTIAAAEEKAADAPATPVPTSTTNTLAAPPSSSHRPSTSRTSSPASTPRTGAPRRYDINLDNFESCEPMLKTVINSPRSLQVCARFGVHPTELVHRPLHQFCAPGVPQAVAKLRFEHYERSRIKKLTMLREERQCLPEEPRLAPPTQPHRAATPTPMQQQRQRPQSAPPPPRRVSSPTARATTTATTTSAMMGGAAAPSTLKASAPPPPAAAVVVRTKAMLEMNARREEARRRSLQLKAQREAEALERQRQREERSRSLLSELLDKKMCDAEMQRLKRADTLEHVKQLARIKEYNASLQATEWERKLASKRRDSFALLSAREQYRTPQQRLERARSASAPRTSFNAA